MTCKVFEAPEGATDWGAQSGAASTGGYDLVIVTASSMGAILKDVAGRFPRRDLCLHRLPH